MKLLYKLIFFLTLLVTNYSVAQGLNDIEKDSIVKIKNTDLSLIYYKKTTAVWHNFANFYVVEPTKNWFIYLNSAKLLVEVDYKHKTFYAVVEDELTGGYKRFLIGENKIQGDIIYARKPETSKKSLKEYIQIDTLYYSKSLKKITSKLIGKKVGEYGLKIKGKLLIITDYINTYDTKPYLFPEVIKSIQYSGKDSITINGKVVYKSSLDKSGISNSGILNLRKREWLLPQKFNTISYSKSELITNPKPTNLNQLNSKIWRKKQWKWEIMSPSYSSIEKIGNIYICTTQQDKYSQSSYIILDKKLKPIRVNDFYNFDLVESTNKSIKITPILSKPTSIFELDFKGNILYSDK